MSDLKRRLILAAGFFAVIAIVATGTALVRRKLASEVAVHDAKGALLPVREISSWGETHPSIQFHAPPVDGQRDTAWMSLAIAVMPPEIVKNGGTVHLLVAQPDWVVSEVNEWADGVVLAALVPDIGIGMELNRIVLKAHARMADRGWNAMEVKVPPCTFHLALEARPGDVPGANNAFDQLLVSVREPLVFRNGLINPPATEAACAVGTFSNDCGSPIDDALERSCGRRSMAPAGTATPAGALHTGAVR